LWSSGTFNDRYPGGLIDEGGAMDLDMPPPGTRITMDFPLEDVAPFADDFTLNNTGPLGGNFLFNDTTPFGDDFVLNNTGSLVGGDVSSLEGAGADLSNDSAPNPGLDAASPNQCPSPIVTDCPVLPAGTHPDIILLYASLWSKSSSTHECERLQGLLKHCHIFETAWVLSNDENTLREPYNVHYRAS
jgi:hypothetical protein